MKLIFSKDEDGEHNVELVKNDVEEFSYVELIKGLLQKKDLDLEFRETVTGEEKEKIKGMVEKINSTVDDQLDISGEVDNS